MLTNLYKFKDFNINLLNCFKCKSKMHINKSNGSQHVKIHINKNNGTVRGVGGRK